MRISTCPNPSEEGKFHGVMRAFPRIWEGVVLDVGCRSGKFKQVLYQNNPFIRYVGLDIRPPADVIADLGKGLPLGDKRVDVVIALDVLEHTDDIHKGFDELCRVARRFIVVTLPNAYELRGRISFLLGLPFSRKYGLPSAPPQDRHRWLFSLNEARDFVQTRGRRCGFEIKDDACLIGPRRGFLFGRLGWVPFPNLLSPWYMALLVRS